MHKMAAGTLGSMENSSVDQLERPEKLQEKVSESMGYPSLFNPDTDDEFSSESSSDLEDLTHAPLLHMNEVVKEPLKTLSAALDVLLPRLQPKADVKGVSIEDQQSLVSILVGELSSQFAVLHHQIDDPFLDSRQNRKLHRQISIEVCKIIEQLYGKFVYQAAVLNQNAPSFSSNMTQLRAQLMIEANQRLNIPLFRRRVLKKLRGSIVKVPVVQRYCTPANRLPPVPKWQLPKARVSHHTGLDTGEPAEERTTFESRLSRFGFRWNARAIRRRIAKLQMRVPPSPIASSSSSDEETQEGWREAKMQQMGKKRKSSALDDLHKRRNYPDRLHRASSHPELWGDFLLCDLGIMTRHKRPENTIAKELLMGLHRPPSVMNLKIKDEHSCQERRPKTALGDYTQQELTEDLQTLQQHSAVQQPISEDDLHPLLQAHIHGLSSKQAARLTEFEASMREREEVALEKPCSPGTSTSMVESIPSVPTLEQLPYLNIEHASGAGSSNPSLHVKSGLPAKTELSSEGAKSMVASSSRFGSTSGHLEDRFGQLSASEEERDGMHASSVGAQSELQLSHDGALVSLAGSQAGLSRDGLSPSSQTVFSGSQSALSRDRLTPDPQLDLSREGSPCPQPAQVGEMMVDPEKVWMEDLSLGLDDVGFMTRETGDSKDIEGAQPQTAVVTAHCPGQGVVRTSDVRVSERTPLMQIRQKFFGPIYNQLADDWDSTTTEELDSNLHEGKEITAVYEEIMKTLSTSHLKFVTEPTLEPSLDTPVSLSKILASRTLHHRRTQRVINENLHRNIPPPWGDAGGRQAWEESNQYKGTDLELHQNNPNTPYSTEIAHHYLTWRNHWKATIDPEDFFKFTSREESDYLRLVYHLYDSEGSDSEDEAERRTKRERLEALEAKLKAKEEQKLQRYRAKSLYQPGLWNVHTVTMGGLGEDPEEPSSASDEEEDRENLKKFNEKASNLETVQKNLQQIWTRLHVPTGQQIDMAIKYSGDITQMELHKVLKLWESVCNIIEQREAALAQLESFEKKASDPSRFFSKGHMGSAAVRLNEAKDRDQLHNVLDRLDKRVSTSLQKLLKEYGDVVTYKGRPYSEKMRLDRTELLYWLQQARRQAVVRPSVKHITLDELFVTKSSK